MSRRREYRRRRKTVLPVFLPAAVIVILICGAFAAMFLLRKSEKQPQQVSSVEAPDYDNADKWSEGVVSYNGKNYRYNKNIRTYLFLGIDTDEPVHKAEDGISGGQADALFLLVENRDKNKLSIIAIHRNTMTKVSMYDRNGEYTGEAELQICLQHGYGDGERTSCQRTLDCVSRLFYGIPIHGYMSLNMGGIGLLNDAIDGVELTVLHNLDSASRNVHLVQGERKILNGEEAYVYVRSRDVSEFDSASDRMERQEQYLSAMLPQMQRKINGAASAMAIYNKAEEYLYSNIDFARLADEMAVMSYNSGEDMHEIPGEVTMGEQFEEFRVDETGLYELILKVFYEELA